VKTNAFALKDLGTSDKKLNELKRTILRRNVEFTIEIHITGSTKVKQGLADSIRKPSMLLETNRADLFRRKAYGDWLQKLTALESMRDRLSKYGETFDSISVGEKRICEMELRAFEEAIRIGESNSPSSLVYTNHEERNKAYRDAFAWNLQYYTNAHSLQHVDEALRILDRK
jgi:hypothetical protein